MTAREVLDGLKTLGHSAGCAAHDDCLRANTARLTRALDAVLAYGEDRKKATHEGGKQADAAVKSYAYHVERLLTEALGEAS